MTAGSGRRERNPSHYDVSDLRASRETTFYYVVANDLVRRRRPRVSVLLDKCIWSKFPSSPSLENSKVQRFQQQSKHREYCPPKSDGRRGIVYECPPRCW